MRRRYVELEIKEGVTRPFIRFKGVKHYLEYRKDAKGEKTGESYVVNNEEEMPVENGFRWRFLKKVPAQYVKF